MFVVKYLIAFVALNLALLGLGACNSAPVGYGAPAGSTVALPANQTLTLPAGAEVRVILSGTVVVPSSGQGEALVPGNNIYVALSCDSCNLLVSDSPDLDNANVENVGRFHELSTGDNGSFQIIASLVSPMKSVITADIGVALATTTLTVTASATGP